MLTAVNVFPSLAACFVVDMLLEESMKVTGNPHSFKLLLRSLCA